MQIAQHAVAAVILISTGADHLSRPHAAVTLLPLLEIAAGAMLFISLVRERLKRGHHGGIAWVELAGAVMTFVEATEKTRSPHHLSFIILTYVQPLVLLVFALLDAQIASALYLKADDDAFVARFRLIVRRRIPWDAMRSFRVDGDGIVFEMTGGAGRRLSLKDVLDRDAALAWSAEQLRRRGIPEGAAS